MPRLPVLTLLFLLLLAADRGNTAALLSGSGVRADGRMEVRSMLDIVGRHQWSRTQPELSGHAAKERESSAHQALERNPRDPRLKERFIKHLTGPLYVNKKCRKHFHRLYHNTRDCTIPAFYKRCARLLTRLANSPHCAER